MIFLEKIDDEKENSDDFGLEHEAEIILDHIERFNDLFENAKYIEAAYFAAASPKNILRNIETLLRFKSNLRKIINFSLNLLSSDFLN